MTHITLSKTTNLKPSLEFFSDGSGKARRVTIEQFPFRIGRSETANLRVDSVEVSREHAEIVERNGMWLVRDLGSTNGTQVNGKTIKETLLADGDILKVAETELTFIASAASQFQRMVTQPVPSKGARVAPNALPPQVVAARTLTEKTLWQATSPRLLQAYSLRDGSIEAYFTTSAPATSLQPSLDEPCAVSERFRQVERLRTLELATNSDEINRLLFSVSAEECGSPQRMIAQFHELQDEAPPDWQLGIAISLPTDIDILRFGSAYEAARDHGLSVAFTNFQGGGSQVTHFDSLVPGYLVLAGSMTKDLLANRQPLRRLESLFSACRELAIKPVLSSHNDPEALALCEEIGFDLVLQPQSGGIATHAAELSLST